MVDRLFNWCFLIDTAFVTFYNLTPRLSLRELTMGLPSPESCFEAVDAQTCLFELQKWQYQTNFDPSSNLYVCLKSFCRAEMDFASQIRFAHQSTVSMFCIASAFHVMIFNSDPDLGPLSQYDPLLMGINNWRAVWNRKTYLSNDHASINSLRTDFGKLGFWKHCPEYWLLAYLLVQQIIKDKSAEGSEFHQTIISRSCLPERDETSQSKLHSFIQAYASGIVAV